jgi:hypothetical protein
MLMRPGLLLLVVVVIPVAVIKVLLNLLLSDLAPMSGLMAVIRELLLLLVLILLSGVLPLRRRWRHVSIVLTVIVWTTSGLVLLLLVVPWTGRRVLLGTTWRQVVVEVNHGVAGVEPFPV